MRLLARLALVPILLGAASCDDLAPTGARRTPAGVGPQVRFDLGHLPLPDIPFPNDVATWPDPTSRTGIRVNASLVAPTTIEADARAQFDRLEGWGTYQGITVAFDAVEPDDRGRAIDLADVARRHQHDDYELADDAVYLVNLKTGVPVPLDLGEGSFSYTVRETDAYWRADPRKGDPALIFETRDESGGNWLAPYTTAADTDFDGVLDRPNLDDPYACVGKKDLERDVCLADHLMTWYERQTDTLYARPLVPLEQMTEYAVVVTDRVHDGAGRIARSPFDFVYHASQEPGARRLAEHLSNPELASYYGDIGGTGLAHVAFTWTFTTQPTTGDMALLRDGLYGKGPFSYFAERFPTTVVPEQLVGLSTKDDVAMGVTEPDIHVDPRCIGKLANPSILKVDAFASVLQSVSGVGFGIAGPDVTELVNGLLAVDYIVVGKFRTPWLLPGGPQSKDVTSTFHLDFRTGEGDVGEDLVNFYLFVPKAKAGHAQPYPVNVFGHGYGGSSIQAIAYAGNMARQGVATIALDAAGHGFDLDHTKHNLLDSIFRQVCAAPLSDALFEGRARDLDGDGQIDPGGDFLSTYVFHTRDMIRQSILDRVQLVRVLRSFDGRNRDGDYDGDGKPNLAGDFDNDGVPDVGGPDVVIGTWGQSLGGILSSVHGGIDTEVDAASPSSPGGGLTDVVSRSNEHEAVNASVLRTVGPLFTAVPAKQFYDSKGATGATTCGQDETSLRFIVPDVNRVQELEFGCGPASVFVPGQTTMVVTNLTNGKVRCGRLSTDGEMRFGLATSVGDYLYVEVYAQPDVVDSYATCVVPSSIAPALVIETWGKGLVTPQQNPSCGAADGCTGYMGELIPAGVPLYSPIEGLGLDRGTPELRRFLQLSQIALDPADPISYAPLYALSPPRDARTGQTAAARGLLTIATVGDQTVPVSTGIALARAAGAVPFLRPDAATRYPALASYATPRSLYASLGNRTPNRVLIDDHVIEGLARLQRHPSSASCLANEVSYASNPDCHPACTACLSGQSCVMAQPTSYCAASLSKDTCAGALFNADDVDEGLLPYGEQVAPVPLRLARLARPTHGAELDAVWAPRLRGVPHAKTNAGAWQPGEKLVGLLNAYIVPEGQHAFFNPAPCEQWDNATYLAQLAAHYLASGGRDIYYLSHPATHSCLATHTCPD
jgi:hypothetical protein